jgi:hypothetical protein
MMIIKHKKMNRILMNKTMKKHPSQKNHPESHIFGDKNEAVETRRKITFDSGQATLSMIEPKSFKESRKSKDWIKSMNEELDQIEKN